MKNALISPNEQARYVSSWIQKGLDLEPVYIVCGQRIAEVSQAPFEVSEPLFWFECADEVTAESYCFVDGNCVAIPEDAPAPVPVAENQPTVSGAETL